MNESTFLQQLEQRTEQVKITLANLEAERTRIEGAIAQLQPIVPHYDALIAAERAIEQAQIRLDATSSQQATQQQHEHHADQRAGAEPHKWGDEAQPEHQGGDQPSEQPASESQSWEEEHRPTW